MQTSNASVLAIPHSMNLFGSSDIKCSQSEQYFDHVRSLSRLSALLISVKENEYGKWVDIRLE